MMKALEGVLKEELKRLVELEKSYVRELKKLSKGSIRHKRLKGHSYAYLVFRQKAKVIHTYLGKSTSSELGELRRQIKQRRQYERLLRETRAGIKRLRQIVHERKRSA
jgi:hypothetical protein